MDGSQTASAASKTSLWREAPGLRNLVVAAAALTAVAIALPLALPGAAPVPTQPPAPSFEAATVARPAATPATPVPAPQIAEAPPPRVVYVEKYIQTPASAQPSVPPQPTAAQAPAPSQAVARASAQEAGACNIQVPGAPGGLGAGTVTTLMTSGMSKANIDSAQALAHGAIDPAYATRLAVIVHLDSGLDQVGRLPPGVAPHVGDRVTMQGWYRNATLSCNYIPNLVTADLGPPAPPPPAP